MSPATRWRKSTTPDHQPDTGPQQDPQDNSPAAGPLRAVVALALVAALIVGVLFVMQQLRHAAAVQDCIASGRTNCAPIAPGR